MKIDVEDIAAAHGLDREDVIEFLRDFLEYTETADLPGLHKSLEIQNLEEVRRRAHSIKGAALNLKLEMIAAPAGKLEKQAANLSMNEMQSLLGDLEEGLSFLADFLRKCKE